MKFRALVLASFALAVGAAPAFAHHSFAMFDGGATVTLEGTVKAFQWIYPHSWILLMVRKSDGEPISIGHCSSSPSLLRTISRIQLCG